jgi:hypothetical protein
MVRRGDRESISSRNEFIRSENAMSLCGARSSVLESLNKFELS